MNGSNSDIPLLLLNAAPHSNPTSKINLALYCIKVPQCLYEFPHIYMLLQHFSRAKLNFHTLLRQLIFALVKHLVLVTHSFIRKLDLTPKYINFLRITRHRHQCVYKRLRYIMTAIRLIKLIRSFSLLFVKCFRKNCFPSNFCSFYYSQLHYPQFYKRTFSYGHPCGQSQM